MRAIFVLSSLCFISLLSNWSDGLECYVSDGTDNITTSPIETCQPGQTLCALGGYHDYRVYGSCTDTSVCKPGPLPGPFPPCGYCCEGDLCNNHSCFG